MTRLLSLFGLFILVASCSSHDHDKQRSISVKPAEDVKIERAEDVRIEPAEDVPILRPKEYP